MATQEPARPDVHTYLMQVAMAIRERANCLGSKIGAVIAVEQRIIATGYNGTPKGMTNCDQGGCHRCAHPEEYTSGEGYDVCICVHAEQNALLSAARFGTAVAGGVLYSTMRPCFGCTKELLQAGITHAYYLHEWTHPNPAVQDFYAQVQRTFPGWAERLDLPDPRKEWAHPRRRAPLDDTGHPSPAN